jgi:NADPH-dependent 2,4-dienoyl-CoA reductase/sulfur reductase-like enzyme
MTTPQLIEGQAGLPVDNPSQSYWHKEPSEKLLGHRTTADLPRSADVVIVGSGITGALAAHTLKEQRPELNVVMLEAREACWGATGRVSFYYPRAVPGAFRQAIW